MDKTVLITGCSSGFGKLLVSEFLEKGWTVHATLRDSAKRADLFSEAESRNKGRFFLHELDVADARHRSETAKSLPRLDVLVNNAGYGLFGALEDLSEEQLRRQMEVNFFGAVLLTRELLPLLRASRGRIINVSSILGLTGFPLASAYCSSKYALEGFSEALYHELKPHGVQVAVVEPGGFRTDFSKKMALAAGASSAQSPYRVQTGNLRRWQERRAAGRGVPPERVVRSIVRLAGTHSMPLRTVVGADATAANLLHRLLPLNWAPSLMSKIFTKQLTKPLEDAA